jgi:hypothetical protein
MWSTTTERVTANTSTEDNIRIGIRTRANIAELTDKSPRAIADRIRLLNREWDVERSTEALAAATILVSLFLASFGKQYWLAITGGAGAFLMQHVLQGWCPALPLIRKLGIRTATEIHEEITALKLLRGDFQATDDPVAALLLSDSRG